MESRAKGWQLRYDRVVAFGLNRRVVEPASNGGCPGSSGEEHVAFADGSLMWPG